MDLPKGDVKPLKGYHAGGRIRLAFYRVFWLQCGQWMENYQESGFT